MKGAVDLLVLAAFPPELSGLTPASLGELGAKDPRVATGVVGVGMVAAAVGAMRAIADTRPRAVVLTGTCGAYPASGLQVSDVVVARAILLVEPAVEEGRAALPGVIARRLDTDERLRDALVSTGAAVADVATTLGITTDDGLAATLARLTGAAVEHLEAYAVALACAEHAIPFVAALGVANPVGSAGRASWLANHEAASKSVNARIAAWIRKGAP